MKTGAPLCQKGKECRTGLGFRQVSPVSGTNARLSMEEFDRCNGPDRVLPVETVHEQTRRQGRPSVREAYRTQVFFGTVILDPFSFGFERWSMPIPPSLSV